MSKLVLSDLYALVYLIFWKSHYHHAGEDSWGKSGALQSMRAQRVRHDLAAEQQQQQQQQQGD